jgi:hypothetical protein
MLDFDPSIEQLGVVGIGIGVLWNVQIEISGSIFYNSLAHDF